MTTKDESNVAAEALADKSESKCEERLMIGFLCRPVLATAIGASARRSMPPDLNPHVYSCTIYMHLDSCSPTLPQFLSRRNSCFLKVCLGDYSSHVVYIAPAGVCRVGHSDFNVIRGRVMIMS